MTPHTISRFGILFPLLATGTMGFQEPGAPHDHIEGGPVTRMSIVSPVDEVPFPIREEAEEAGEGADAIAGSGNPFFLGYVAGPYFPPEGESIDPELLRLRERVILSQRPRPELYACVMFQKRMTAQRLGELRELGVRFLGFQPHYAVRCALKPDAIEAVARHPAVRWVGRQQPWQKVQPQLERVLLAGLPGDVLDLWVFVQDDDRCEASTARPMGAMVESDLGVATSVTSPAAYPVLWQSRGWQQCALEEVGVGIDWYEPTLRAFRAKVRLELVEVLSRLDLVSFLELVTPPRPAHDEATPMIHADYTRQFWNGNSSQNAVAGIIDSGVVNTHSGLDHVFMAGWDFLGASPWTDECDHGTHVSGTILAEPAATADRGYRGVAPGLGSTASLRFRSVKGIYQPPGKRCEYLGPAFSLVLGTMRSAYTDTQGNVSPRPHVVNNSWGKPHDEAAGGIWSGTEATSIAFDAEVYANRQVYVFSAGNKGPGASTLGTPGVAKNVFTVGSVEDSVRGDGIANSSSRGPCGDGRWKPNVVAPGSVVTSTVPSGGYAGKAGTSMAAPHVTGLIAQLIDHYSSLAYDPPRMHAYLMATAWQRNNAEIRSETDPHLNTYGAGRVDAYRTHYDTVDWDRSSWSYTHQPGGWHFASFDVPAGATRLVVCMNYIEPPSLPGVSQALVHDLDLYLDRPPTDPTVGNSGEYTLQISSRDNSELRVVDDPPSGTWLWKVYPRSLSPLAPPPEVGVAVLVVLGDREPDLQATMTASPRYVRPNDSIRVDLSVEPSDYLASAVGTEISDAPDQTITAAGTVLLDGTPTDLTRGNSGRWMRLGGIREGRPRTASWTLEYATEGTKTLTVTTTSESATTATTQETVIVDGTPPPAPSTLASTTHQVGVWSNSRTIDFAWTEPTDNLSGIEGYADEISSRSPFSVPDRLEFNATTGRSYRLTQDYATLYYGLRAFDRSGNRGTPAFVGPYRIDSVDPDLPMNLASPSHTVGQWSNDPNLVITWSPATDATSGLDGYGEGEGRIRPLTVSAVKVLEETATTRTLRPTSGRTGFYYALRSVDNAGNWSRSTAEIGPFLIDTEAPDSVSNLASTSHSPGNWSMDPNVIVHWSPAGDAHSGVDGYATRWDTSAGTIPTQVTLGRGETTATGVLRASANGYYFHIRPRDLAGNWGPTQHLGPFLIDDVAPGAPSGLRSPTHALAQWSTTDRVLVEWGGSVENESGLAGYASVWDQSPGTVPAGINLPAGASSEQRTLSESIQGWYVHLRAFDVAGNASPTVHLGPFQIDVTPPADPPNLTSTTHVPGTWSMATLARIQWDAASDGTSGLGAYAIDWDSSPTTVPTVQNTSSNATFSLAALRASARGYYAHLRPRDVAGNWGNTLHVGPFLVDDQAPPPPGNPNSPTHALGSWTASDQLQVDWSTVTDPHSGLQGWRFLVDTNPTTTLTPPANLAAGLTSTTETVASSANPFYAHLVAIDQAGNVSPTEHLGPIRIDVDPPTNVTVLIEGGGTSVGTPLVDLDVAASDAHSGLAEMRFKNDGGTWSPWEPFATSRAWDLFAFGGSTETGVRRVDLEVRDRAGNAVSVFDRVFYFRPFRWLEPGCAGSQGVPMFDSPDVAAFVGAPSFELHLANTAAPAVGLYMGLSDQLWNGLPLPLDLALVGSPGCFVHVSLELPIYSGPTIGTVTIPMVNDPVVIGLVFYFQWLLFGDPSGLPIVTTRGLEAEINRS